MDDVTAMAKGLLSDDGGKTATPSSEEEALASMATYKPKETAKAEKSLRVDEEYEGNDDGVVGKGIELDVSASDVKSEPRYDKLKRIIHDGGKLYKVKNTSNKLFGIDWDLALLPNDMQDDFKKYLEGKYIAYGLRKLLGNTALMVRIYKEGRTVDFLHNYLVEAQIPTLVPAAVGRDTIMVSKVIIPAGESAVFTERQLESLEKFEKVMRKSPDGEMSDWLGFLVFTELSKETVVEVPRSYVFEEDIRNGALVVDSKEFESKKSGRAYNSEVIRATE